MSRSNASQMERDSKASLFSLFAVKLGVIKAGQNGSTCENCLPSHVQGKQQRKTALSLSLTLVPLLFYFYNLKPLAGSPTESTNLPFTRRLT